MRDFVTRIRERGGFERVEEAERVTLAILDALARQLMPGEARLVAEGVPPSLAARLTEVTHLGGGGLEAVIAGVAAREAVGLGIAKEHVEVVLSVIGERLDEESRARVRRDLPADLAAAFLPPPSETAPAREGSPRGTPLPRPHAHSVAEDNPHGGSKLSSGHEETGEGIATARPGSRRPLSEKDR